MLDYQFVDGTRLTSVIEALIFASPEPVSWEKISAIVKESEEELNLDETVVKEIIGQLNSRYEENGLSFRIDRTGGGYTFVTQPRYHPWLSIYQHENAYRRLSQPAIETLAIVAYRQPITKPEVDSIRGVDSGYILRQLMEKMLIKVSGRADSVGKPLLYKTTDHFLKHFGINAVDELPKPREIDEILKDDDMAEHRRMLLERQMELEDLEAKELVEGYSRERGEVGAEVEEIDEVETGADDEAGADGDGNDEVKNNADKESGTEVEGNDDKENELK
jgi:segregation and condensation protein B